MTHAQLDVNRYVAEQALLEARRFGFERDAARARHVLSAIDARKSVKRLQRTRTETR